MLEETAFLSNNLYLTGLLLLITGGLLDYFRKLLTTLISFFIHKYIHKVDIEDRNNDSYGWVLNYLSLNPNSTVVTESQSTNYKDDGLGYTDNGIKIFSKTLPKLSYFPSYGYHLLKYGYHYILISHYSVQRGFGEKKCITLYSWDSKKTVIPELIHEAMKASWDKEVGKTSVYVPSSSNQGWDLAVVRDKRSFDSVILSNNTANEILEDATKFLSSKEIYNSLGVPYRRSYLLHGCPGTGKTSLVVALAGKLDLNVCLLNLSNKNMTDTDVATLLRSAPLSALILAEDVDAAFPERNNDPNKTKIVNKVTFSGILNAIDGIAAQQGHVFIMTTNHPEKLDPALTRPGRVDRVIQFEKSTPSQAKKLFERFFPEHEELASDFENKFPHNKVTMAKLQNFLMFYYGKPEDVLKNMNQLEEPDPIEKLEEASEKHEEIIEENGKEQE